MIKFSIKNKKLMANKQIWTVAIGLLLIILVLVILKLHNKNQLNDLTYGKDWTLTKNVVTRDSVNKVIENEDGIKITICTSKQGFGSQYYGEDYIQNYVHITKMDTAQYVFRNKSEKDKFVVAKVSVYAYEDGSKTEGLCEWDGPVFYAVLPESYLGDSSYCGMGYYPLCAWGDSISTVVIAEADDGKFNATSEKEVVQILASYRGRK